MNRIALPFLIALDVAIVAVGLAWPGAAAERHALAVAFVAFPMLAITAPAMAARAAMPALVAVAVVAAIHALGAALAAAPLTATIGVFEVALAFGVFAAGIAVCLRGAGTSAGAAAAGGSLASLALLALPFGIDLAAAHPSIGSRRIAIESVVLAVHPFAGLASAFSFDWLRADRMYALSEMGSDPYRYPAAGRAAAILATLGVALGAAGLGASAVRARFRRSVDIEKSVAKGHCDQ
jgi:hypothetical protein